MEQYYIIRPAGDDGDCALYDTPEDLENFHLPARGKPFGDDIPERLEFHMAAEEPGFNVPDLVWNAFNYLIVSDAFKKLLEDNLRHQQVEFIPCSIINHKGRVAVDNYFVVNIIGALDCVDMANTNATPGMRKGQINIIKKLNIFPEKIPAEIDIFRIKERPGLMLVSHNLKEKIEKNSLSGVEFFNLNEDVYID